MVISLILFLTYHFAGTFSRNAAEDGSIDSLLGSWLPNLIMFPLGIYLISRASSDKAIFTGPLCAFCDAAKKLLTRNNVEYKEIDISTVDGAMDEMIKKANGKRTIPQIFFDDQHIGGYDETRALEKENKLQELLK